MNSLKKKKICLVSNNRINIIHSKVEEHRDYVRVIPELSLPGILPEKSTGYLKISKNFPSIPFEIRIDAPAFGKFYIYRTK